MSLEDAVGDAVDRDELDLGERKLIATIPGPDGKPQDIEIWEPTMEQIAWLGNMSGRKQTIQSNMMALGDLIEDLFEPEVSEELWHRMRNRKDPLKLEHVTDAIAVALEAVQDFPTEPSSGSSPSSRTRSNGKRSTGRVRGPGSTQSSSRRVGS